jgi:hypothetical protein
VLSHAYARLNGGAGASFVCSARVEQCVSPGRTGEFQSASALPKGTEMSVCSVRELDALADFSREKAQPSQECRVRSVNVGGSDRESIKDVPLG